MNRTIAPISLAAGAMAFALAVSTAALGQTKENGRDVKIEASKVVVLKERRTGPGLVHDETVQLSRQVSFADLDLGTTSGEAELHRRISDTAASVCRQLGTLSPAGSAQQEMLDQNACVKRAVDGAMAQMKPVVAAARQTEHE